MPLDFETKGSPKIKSDDGNFEMVFGARAHLDVHSFDNDNANPAYPAFGSQLPDGQPHSGFNFRRGYTDVTAKSTTWASSSRTILPQVLFREACAKPGSARSSVQVN